MDFPSSSSSAKVNDDQQQNVGTDEMMTVNDGNENDRGTQAQTTLPLPSLRGKLMSDGALNICRGVWAMNDAAHEIPDQCRYT